MTIGITLAHSIEFWKLESNIFSSQFLVNWCVRVKLKKSFILWKYINIRSHQQHTYCLGCWNNRYKSARVYILPLKKTIFKSPLHKTTTSITNIQVTNLMFYISLLIFVQMYFDNSRTVQLDPCALANNFSGENQIVQYTIVHCCQSTTVKYNERFKIPSNGHLIKNIQIDYWLGPHIT